MAEETITIVKIGTDEAVKSIADLRENVRILKRTLEETQVDTQEGWQKYQDTLEELKVNQNALKDAMYATSGSFEDVAKAATGTSNSYNALVHRMAALKEEFRSTEDVARRVDLGGQIKEINDQLKDMDALQGNYQRNVGNYANSIKEAFGDMSVNVDVFRKSLGSVGGGLNGFKDGLEGISKSPFIATFGILVSIAIKLADELKENETAMEALKKASDALQPVMDFLSGIIESLAEFLADIIGKVTQFVTSNGLMTKIVKGVMGVGNAILQYVIAPFKGVIAAIKVFQEEGVKGIGNAAKAFGREMKQGISFKQNFEAGQVVAETMIAGAKSKKKAVRAAGKEMGKEVKDGLLEEIDKLVTESDKLADEALAAMQKAEDEANKAAVKKAEGRLKALDDSVAHQQELNSILLENESERAEKDYQIQADANQRKLSLLDQYMQEALDRNDLDAYLAFDQERADLEVEIETNALREKERLRRKDLKDAEDKTKKQKELLSGLANATSDILGSIADLYESDEENAEKNAEKVKGLRIAAATIDTISGAVAAYMNAQKTGLPPFLSIPMGVLSAATVTAAGLAQIAKMKSTKATGSASTGALAMPSATPAPALTTQVSNVRSVTSASEEDRLNQMASDQRVYILASDIEASQNQIKTQVEESSF